MPIFWQLKTVFIARRYMRPFFLTILLFPWHLWASELPDLGNSSAAVLTPKQEFELGRSIVKEISHSVSFFNDVVVNDYLFELGHRLVATHGSTQTRYQFFTIKDKTINAFALPGGFVGVNTGLFMAAESESELAGVLAHEIGHVHQHHIARMYEHMGRLKLSTIAGVIASILIATQSPQAGSGALAATLAGGQQAMINYTRDHEKEADYVGIQALAKAGFDPMGMPSFFHRMYQDTRYYSNHMPEYLMTHPLTESRLMAAQNRAKSFPYRQVADSLLFHLVQARILIYSSTSIQEANHHFSSALKRGNYRSRAGTLYGYALTLIEQGKPTQARPYLEELLSSYPNEPLFELAFAQMEYRRGNVEPAIEHLSTSVKNHPNHYVLGSTLSKWQIEVGHTQAAIDLLKKQTSSQQRYPQVWHQLSVAYSLNQQSVQAHLAQAQYLHLIGDYNNAITQLKLAKNNRVATAHEKRQIEAKLKEILPKMTKDKSKS